MEGHLDLWTLLTSTGIVVKIVLLLLIGCSIFSWAIIIAKYKSFKKESRETSEFSDLFKKADSLELINGQAISQDNLYSRLFTSGYEELGKIKNSTNQVNLNPEHIIALERSFDKAIIENNDLLESRLSHLASIASIAPFIGLLGTVWGIMDSFTGLASGGGSIEVVAPGIAEALIATAIGLAAAIPASWFYNYFTAQIMSFNKKMESIKMDLLNLIQRTQR